METVTQGLLTRVQLVDCSRRSQRISVLLPNLLFNFYKNNLIATFKVGDCYLLKNILITERLKITKMLEKINSSFCEKETARLFHDTRDHKQNPGNS